MEQLPGIELYPDLQIGLRRELRRVGCNGCERTVVLQKYKDLIARRDVEWKPPKNIVETSRR